MYKAFNVNATPILPASINPKATLVRRLFHACILFNNRAFLNENDIHEYIDECASEEIIDASKIEDSWFPSVKANVFISHSHADEDDAINLACYLKVTYGLDSFIDSTVWGYAPELLKQMKEKYRATKDEDVIYLSTRINMILSMALTKMIDNCEVLFFYNTENSLNFADSSSTSSPWLYHELGTAQLIEKKLGERPISEGVTKTASARVPPFKYSVQISNLPVIDETRWSQWERFHSSNPNEHPLDSLYSVMGLK